MQKFESIRPLLRQAADEVRLTVVNDGSPHNITPENIARLKQLMPDIQVVSYEQNRGKGYALRQGVAATEADFYIVTDADFPYTPDSMLRVATTLREQGGIQSHHHKVEHDT